MNTLEMALLYIEKHIASFSKSDVERGAINCGFIKIESENDIHIFYKDHSDNWVVECGDNITEVRANNSQSLINSMKNLNPTRIIYCFNDLDTFKVLWG